MTDQDMTYVTMNKTPHIRSLIMILPEILQKLDGCNYTWHNLKTSHFCKKMCFKRWIERQQSTVLYCRQIFCSLSSNIRNIKLLIMTCCWFSSIKRESFIRRLRPVQQSLGESKWSVSQIICPAGRSKTRKSNMLA